MAADDGLWQTWDAVGAIAALGEVVDADSMKRRRFMAMTGLTPTVMAHQWRFDPAAARGGCAAEPYASSAVVREFDIKYYDLMMGTTSA